MEIKIYDYSGSKLYADWSKGQYSGLTYSSEVPGGMLNASFTVPEEYYDWYDWARLFNQVEIYHQSTLVWSGFVFGLERYWDESSSGIKVDCVGYVAKLGTTTTNANLSNEKGSTYINDHILASTPLAQYLTSSSVATGDYTISGVVEAKPRKTMREMVDALYAYNANAYDWYVWDHCFYWQPRETSVSYKTRTKHSTGSCRQELSNFANYLRYSYTDANGVIQTGYEDGTADGNPSTVVIESYSGNMTAAQAEQAAEESLANHLLLGSTASIEVKRAEGTRGEVVHPSEIRPGKLIRVEGLVPAQASISEVFEANDLDTFLIRGVTWNDDAQSMSVNPGAIGLTIPVVLARLAK